MAIPAYVLYEARDSGDEYDNGDSSVQSDMEDDLNDSSVECVLEDDLDDSSVEVSSSSTARAYRAAIRVRKCRRRGLPRSADASPDEDGDDGVDEEQDDGMYCLHSADNYIPPGARRDQGQ